MPRRSWYVLGALTVVVGVAQVLGPHATAWHYFHDAARLLVGEAGPGEAAGVRLYRDRPDLQFGPLNAIVALPFTVFGETGGARLAMAATAALGLAAFAWLLGALRGLCPGAITPAASLVAGAVFVATWSLVAVRTAHIDDAIALAATAFALRALARRDGWPAALALGVAAAAKPWAIAFAPLVLVTSGRRAVRSAAVLAVPALTWMPFVLAEPATLDTAGHAIPNDATSVLRVLGVDEDTTPGWARPVQLAGGVAVATAVVALGRWPGAVLAGVSWRLLFEPGANRYYTIGFVLGALVVELLARPGKLPLLTAAAAVLLTATAMDAAPSWSGWLRAAVVVAGLGAAVAAAPAERRGRHGGPADR